MTDIQMSDVTWWGNR